MAEIQPFTVTIAGGAATYNAAASGDTAKCGPGYFLHAKNANAASRTVTIAVPGNTAWGEPNPDKVYTLAADSGEQMIPLLDEYKDPSDGLAHFTWSATTGVTRAVIKR
ncbi:hypothetical protein [Phytohabitans houttuyneae]|uniref:Uncharacterized protein n=1 Tax=Phytohabitans houttuyneae TaxID=1076126 RepID=A0A6V8KBF8_9ACTN|nr:hypothetical protein [Phytohabitans houttuyneae]GFJ79479.1 hypothetical protein Phou_036590 [Phytohabitans houttuyneae]